MIIGNVEVFYETNDTKPNQSANKTVKLNKHDSDIDGSGTCPYG